MPPRTRLTSAARRVGRWFVTPGDAFVLAVVMIVFLAPFLAAYHRLTRWIYGGDA